ncbi:hypothetical protein GN244_ATG07086 [Phytophthora infestans]|uniref:Uncharacterized protein n=1 Tax=Phytophthora infestans TaxID=4787 RepID=A0A833TBU3_PHYIN|nr:hypothetical protein GN244_ATG07086 [Phytophthora infestans]
MTSVYIAVYCLVVLAMLLVVGYAYWAWRGYRQAMRDALMRRHERDVERGEHVLLASNGPSQPAVSNRSSTSGAPSIIY